MSTIVTFGEIMGRLSPPGFSRLAQRLPGSLDVTFAGAEANVAASIAMLGGAARFVTALPQNTLGTACVRTMRGLGVDTNRILQKDSGRLGLYFVESGANQRPSQVVYDRAGSTISTTTADEYDWPLSLSGCRWLHVSGITPALSRDAADSTLSAVQTAQQLGLTVSCDLNFRQKLWRWDPARDPRDLAQHTMREILPHVDLVIANEADCHDVLGIVAADTDVDTGRLAVDQYPRVAASVIDQFPNVSRVGITLRQSHSASHNDWGGMLYTREAEQPGGSAYFAPLKGRKYQPYPIRSMVDRVGAGDAFAAGLIFASTTPDLADPATAIRFAVAASCLAHSITGDFNYSTRPEVESLMAGSTSGRVIR